MFTQGTITVLFYIVRSLLLQTPTPKLYLRILRITQSMSKKEELIAAEMAIVEMDF